MAMHIQPRDYYKWVSESLLSMFICSLCSLEEVREITPMEILEGIDFASDLEGFYQTEEPGDFDEGSYQIDKHGDFVVPRSQWDAFAPDLEGSSQTEEYWNLGVGLPGSQTEEQSESEESPSPETFSPWRSQYSSPPVNATSVVDFDPFDWTIAIPRACLSPKVEEVEEASSLRPFLTLQQLNGHLKQKSNKEKSSSVVHPPDLQENVGREEAFTNWWEVMLPLSIIVVIAKHAIPMQIIKISINPTGDSFACICRFNDRLVVLSRFIRDVKHLVEQARDLIKSEDKVESLFLSELQTHSLFLVRSTFEAYSFHNPSEARKRTLCSD